MEEGLLTLSGSKSNTNGASSDCSDVITPGGFSSSATLVVVLSALVALCGSFGYGCAVGYSSSAESGILEDLGLTIAAYSLFGSILTIGGIIGALVNGKLTDLIGRRGTMWLSQVFSAAGWFTMAFAQSVWWLDFGRFSLGVGISIICYVVPVYIAEITPKDLRGRFTSAHQLMMSCGVAMAFFLGTVITWRTLASISAIPSLVHTIGLFFIPESPRWLAKIGRQKDFEAVLQHLRGKNADISQKAAEIMDYTKTFEQHSGKVIDLFQKRYAHSLIVGVGLMSLQHFGGANAVSGYASSIFADADSWCCLECALNRQSWKTTTSNGFGWWIVLEFVSCGIGILLSGPQSVEGGHSQFGVHRLVGSKCIIHNRRSRITLGYNVRDIPHKR